MQKTQTPACMNPTNGLGIFWTLEYRLFSEIWALLVHIGYITAPNILQVNPHVRVRFRLDRGYIGAGMEFLVFKPLNWDVQQVGQLANIFRSAAEGTATAVPEGPRTQIIVL